MGEIEVVLFEQVCLWLVLLRGQDEMVENDWILVQYYVVSRICRWYWCYKQLRGWVLERIECLLSFIVRRVRTIAGWLLP